MSSSAPKPPARPPRDPQSGVVAVWMCILALPLFILFAMALNMGILMDTKTELQGAADATALAAARSLDGTASGLTKARVAAGNYSEQHTAYGDAVTINSVGSDVVFGKWDFTTRTFSVLDESDPHKITAVKVSNGRDAQGSHNAALTLPFGEFLNHTTATLHAGAVAVGGGASKVRCVVPFGLSECKVMSLSNVLQCGRTRFVFSNDANDGVGFVGLSGSQPSGNSTADFIRGGMCKDEGDGYQTGSYKVQNGNDFNQQVISAMTGDDGHGKKSGTADCMIGQSYTFPVLDLGCPNPKFNSQDDVVGYLQAKIVEITDNKGAPQACAGDTKTPVAVTPTVKQQSIVLDISCDPVTATDSTGGGEFFNSAGAKLRIVQ
jgi:hypothetical protein